MRKSSYRAEDVFNLDALIEYVTNSDELTEAVGQCVAVEIETLVESAIENADIPSLVEDALPDYSREISDLSDEVGRLEIELDKAKNEIESWMDGDYVAQLGERVATLEDLMRAGGEGLQAQVDGLTGLIKGLQEQNLALYQGLGEAERKIDLLRAEQDVTRNVFEEIWRRIRKSRLLNWVFTS
jgi:predicted  nucleic acid-binding Zn-ribbon protein